MPSSLPPFPTVEALIASIRDGSLPPSRLIDQTLQRIEQAQPALNAFRIVFTDSARSDAAAADADPTAAAERPLGGVPIAIKDTAGVRGQSAMLGTGSPEPVASDDDELVRRLRKAGAIPVGLTHLPELALWAATETRWHGVTRNPWNLDLAPGGSSGGSAAAVAAGLVPVAHATDGLGSIRIPASACGLVGLKATHGLVPLTGHDSDHWLGMSHAGFLTRTVRDTAIVLDAVLPGSQLTASLAERPGLRVAISAQPWTPVPVDADVEAGLARTGAIVRDLGHMVSRRDPPYGNALSPASTLRYLAGMAQDRQRLTDPEAVEQRTRQLAAIGRRIPGAAQRWARGVGDSFGRRMTEFFTDVDVLLTPTVPVLPAQAGDLSRRQSKLPATIAMMLPYAGFTGPWNACGFPALSVPAATAADGTPIGMQLVGPPGSEARLLGVAAALEEQIGWPARHPDVPELGA